MDKGWRKNYLRYRSFFLNVITQYRERSDWKAYLEILLSLATISVFSLFALRPTLLTIAELITQIEEKKATIAKMDAKIQNLSKAQLLTDQKRNEIQILENFVVPQTPNSDVFARQIEGLSNKHQLPVLTMNLGKATILGKQTTQAATEGVETDENENAKSSDDITFSVSTIAAVDQYPIFVNFLSDFENMRVLTKVNILNFSLKSINSEGTQRGLILTLSGVMPYINSK